VRKVKSAYFEEEYFAPRPASEKLLCKKLKYRGKYLMSDWKTSLKIYLNNSYSDYIL